MFLCVCMLTEYSVESRRAVHVINLAELLHGRLPGIVHKLYKRVPRSKFVQHRATHSCVCNQQVYVSGFILDLLGGCLEGLFTRHVPDQGYKADWEYSCQNSYPVFFYDVYGEQACLGCRAADSFSLDSRRPIMYTFEAPFSASPRAIINPIPRRDMSEFICSRGR